MRRYGCLLVPLAVLLVGAVWLAHRWIVSAAAPHDLAVRSVIVLTRPAGNDYGFETTPASPVLLVTLSSRTDFEAYVHRHGFRAYFDTVPCPGVYHGLSYLFMASVFDRYGVIDAEALEYGRSTPTQVQAIARPATSGPADRAGNILYRVYVPARTDGTGRNSFNLRNHPEDVCFRIFDLQKFLPGYETNTVTIPKALIAAAFSHPN